MPPVVPALPPGLTVLERGWLSSNNIVFTAGGDATVVDTGYVNHADDTVRLVDAALAGRPLQRIVNTHLHSDHAGGNAALCARHPRVRVLIPPGLADAVTRWDDAALSHRDTGQQCPPFRHDAVIAPGSTVRLGSWSWDVLPADGHDSHMVMLWCAELGVLVSADALWEHGFGVLFPVLAGNDGGFEAQMATLQRIEDLQPRVVIPGHGAPFGDAPAALDRARGRLLWMAEDPVRHAQLALKGLVAFALLDRQQMGLGDVAQLIGQGLMVQPGFRAHLDAPPEALADQVMAQLVRVGAAQALGPGRWGAPDTP